MPTGSVRSATRYSSCTPTSPINPSAISSGHSRRTTRSVCGWVASSTAASPANAPSIRHSVSSAGLMPCVSTTFEMTPFNPQSVVATATITYACPRVTRPRLRAAAAAVAGYRRSARSPANSSRSSSSAIVRPASAAADACAAVRSPSPSAR